ncbi:MAG TPA: CmcJ/NvfI family oxidoreductase [Stellaceae bacterium]|nr:CmcJ/NvfI family oxidoreductase [Stellaceae bacterium]
MDGLVGADLKGVVASLTFLEPMAEKPFSYNYEPPAGTPLRNGRPEAHEITVRDARPIAGSLSLDRQGFVLIRQPTAAKNLYDEAEIASVYYPECERIMQEATGAGRVVAFDHIIRNEAKAAIKGSGVKLPAARIHNDYTAKSAPQRVRDLMGDEAEALLKHRFAIINLWRPIRGPLLKSPLALCDAQSLSDENLISSDLRYPDRTGETQQITFNPGQRYYYFPRMQADEAVLIRCFDSALEGPARFSAHGAFADPQSPPDAPARESIEVRTLVFYAPAA